MIPDPRTFLDEVAAYIKAQLASAADRAPRLATVNPAHPAAPPSTKPRVTFDGDTALGEKSLPYLASYTPTASDRVLVLPVGNTYVIVGKVQNS
ncbi:hypothetical protein [Amycolatopsis albispora]|uniref:Uncharacterized protein n=1 Tax=Amycolatopsis albispora TaxID=1804986 RepID=A0A344LGZ3_9PSEU|nr:hypothetical protein [Amycolatopsis albispora]AXB47317.1 hypothetical protein A4R43_36730 [Amycolatopsis albispora]